MVVTFGSIGDIIALSLLIKDLVKSLDDSRGSAAEYQAVIRELRNLDHALLEVEAFFQASKENFQLNALSVTANECTKECRECITSFQQRIEKYGKSLQDGGSSAFIAKTVNKIRWQMSEKEDLAMFRAEIKSHCQSLNILLGTASVSNEENISNRLDKAEVARVLSTTTQITLLEGIKSRAAETKAVLTAGTVGIRSLGSKLDLIRTTGAEIFSFVRTILTINLSTYNAVVALHSRIPTQIEGQLPITFEDALGRIVPVYLDFIDCWEAFDSILELRFRGCPGYRKVMRREYALHPRSLRKDIGQSIAFNQCFLPGQRIYMDMVLDGESYDVETCPGCKLNTTRTGDQLDIEVECSGCGMLFQRIKEIKSDDSDVDFKSSSAPQSHQLAVPLSPYRILSSNLESHDSIDEPQFFRRVRLEYQIMLDHPDTLSSAQILQPKSHDDHDTGQTYIPAKEAALNDTPSLEETIKFRVARGRKYTFPWELCKDWNSMELLIRQVFLHADKYGLRVANGEYDLVGPDNEIITKSSWETVVRPGCAITMHMWSKPELSQEAMGEPADINEPEQEADQRSNYTMVDENNPKKATKSPPSMSSCSGKPKNRSLKDKRQHHVNTATPGDTSVEIDASNATFQDPWAVMTKLSVEVREGLNNMRLISQQHSINDERSRVPALA